MINNIPLLEENEYFVDEAHFTNNSIYIKFDGHHKFKTLPKGFDVSYQWQEVIVNHAVYYNQYQTKRVNHKTLIYYSENIEKLPDCINKHCLPEPTLNKTQADIEQIKNDFEKWVDSFCLDIRKVKPNVV